MHIELGDTANRNSDGIRNRLRRAIPFFSNTYGLHTVHGRALPAATGVKLGNPNLTVFAVGGDGDGLAIGGGHLPHIARRNINVNYLLFDNSIYGLTKGQPSPSSPMGTKTKASPYGTRRQATECDADGIGVRSFICRKAFCRRPQGYYGGPYRRDP